MNYKNVIKKSLALIFIISVLVSASVELVLAADIENEEIGATAPSESVNATAPSESINATAPSQCVGTANSNCKTDTKTNTTVTTKKTKSYSNKYKVKAIKSIKMYKGAGTKYSVVKKISKGTVLYITNNSSGNWVKVKNSKSVSGYVQTKYINKTSGSLLNVTCKTKDYVNLRKGAGKKYLVLKVIPKGKTVNVSSNSNSSWVKVQYKGKKGYISKSFTKIIFKKKTVAKSKPASTEPVTTIPVATTPTKPASPDTAVVPDKNGTFKLKYKSVSMYSNCYYQNAVVSNTTGETIKWSSSNKSIATVDADGIIYGVKSGSAKITAKTTYKKITFTLKVKTPSRSVNISNKNYTVNSEKTVYLGSSTSGVTWTSLDKNRATVSGGLVKCKKAGKVVILAKLAGGWASCVMTVKPREAVRFTYANPNSAPKNSNVTFVAITDKARKAVKFVVKKGKSSFTVKATSKKASGDTYIWKGSKKLTSAGSYSIVAYSSNGIKWSKSTGSYGNAFVTSVESDTATSCEKRHASNKIISFISNYEGFLSKAIFDPLTNFPCLTVGYGRVIYVGESFYNGMTKEEAMAYLVESVETDGYVSKVNSFLLNNKIKFNQRQFDSLVSLVYNCGTGILTSDTDIQSVLFKTYPSSEKNPTKGKISSKCSMRKSAGGKAKIVKTLTAGTSVTLLSGKTYSGSYYYVKDKKGTKGYISYKSLQITSYNKKGTRDLNNTIKNNYIKNFLCYHHAGGSCYYGLLYRRIDECEIYFHGDYTRDGEKNKYNINFRCYSHNPSFGC